MMTPGQQAELEINAAADPDHAASYIIEDGEPLGWIGMATILAAGALGWWILFSRG
jgi:hypothetical protein